MNSARQQPGRRFWIGFLLATLLIAGGLSYLASSSPDGLDSATLQGCQISDLGGAEQVTGECIARNAREHPLSGTLLANYLVGGHERSVGLAGVAGVAVTLALAAGLFRIIGRGRP